MTATIEILHRTTTRIAVRGHHSDAAMQQFTGRVGIVTHIYWRHAFTPYCQRQLFRVERSRYVEARGKGPGAFPVTLFNVQQPSGSAASAAHAKHTNQTSPTNGANHAS